MKESSGMNPRVNNRYFVFAYRINYSMKRKLLALMLALLLAVGIPASAAGGDKISEPGIGSSIGFDDV